MIGVILAAGMAKRLRPLTDHRPKCLLEIGSRTLLQRAFDAMISAGLRQFVVVTGFHAEMIRDFLNRQYPGLDITFLHNADYPNNNNIYSLWMSGQVVRGKEFLLLDSDILFDPEILKVILSQDGSALALNRHPLGEEEMKVVVDADNNITEISKTCSIDSAIGESMGIEKFSESYSAALFELLDHMIIEEHLIDIFYERAFERLIPEHHTFKVIDTTDYFSIELDTVEDFTHAKDIIPSSLF